MQLPPNEEPTSRPLAFFFLMAFLAFLTSFIGWNFYRTTGLIVGFIFSCVVNIYALRIKLD
jgi:hypothetical protein